MGISTKEFKLVDLAKGVSRFPEGPGRRHLTMAVEHARREQHSEVTLDQINEYISEHQIGKDLCDMGALDQNPDGASKTAFANLLAQLR